MTPAKKEAIENLFQHTPETIQLTLEYMDWWGIAESLGHHYQLSPMGIDNLITEIGLLLSGTSDPSKLSDEISYRCRTDAHTTQRIVEDIHDHIVMELRRRIAALSFDENEDNTEPSIIIPHKKTVIPKKPDKLPSTSQYTQTKDPYREFV